MFGLSVHLSKRCSPETWDLVSGLLYQFHSQGVQEAEEPPPTGEAALLAGDEFQEAIAPGILLPPEQFIAYFENRRDAERAERAIAPHLSDLSPQFTVFEVEEKNYVEIWKENLKPLWVDPCWIVRAPWHDNNEVRSVAKTAKTAIELIVEPGMAFGTGSHETTRACLNLMVRATDQLDQRARDSAHVLDFGCGSGILAVALKKLNIANVYGVDIDPLAVEASHYNAKQNQVQFDAFIELPKLPNLDGIVANILKNTLLEFAPKFHQWLKPNGFLILSGLLTEQEQTILDHFNKLGFKLTQRIEENNWVSLYLTKN